MRILSPSESSNANYENSHKITGISRFSKVNVDDFKIQENSDTEVVKNIGNFVVKILPWVDPTLGNVCLAIKFGDYAYHFISKVTEENKKTGDIQEAILNVANTEIQEKITILLKTRMIGEISKLLIEQLWDSYIIEHKINTHHPDFSNISARISKESMIEVVSSYLQELM